MPHAPKKVTKTDIPAGTLIGTCYQVLVMGTVPYFWEGKEVLSCKIKLTFELPEELKVFKEGEGAKPFSISEDFGFTMGKKSKLRPFVEGILGVKFTDDEAYGFDVFELIGESCLLNITHTEKDGNVYANIKSAQPLLKSMKKPKMFNEALTFDVNDFDEEKFMKLPEWLQVKIKASREYEMRLNGENMDNGVAPF